MRQRKALIPLTALAMGCAVPSDKVNTELDIYEFAPGATGVDATDDEEGTASSVPISWEGPEVEPVEDAAWGGLGVYLGELDCTVWWAIEGDEVPCGDCEFGFEFQGYPLGDTCGIGIGDIAFQLEVFDGLAYGFGTYWGVAAAGGGVLTWDGYAGYYGYRYYGFVNYR